MPRRPAPPADPSAYLYKNLEECETKGNHRATPLAWPPVAKNSMEKASMELRCDLCGCHLIVSADNDPDRTGIDIVIPVRQAKPVAV